MTNAITVWERGRLDGRVGPRQVLFGRMYEDSRIELDAFSPGSRVFCIASAGCTAMRLAPHHEVVAVDINPVQLEYAARRIEGDPGFRGRAERVMDFMRFFAPLAGWWPARVRSFVALSDPTAQLDYWNRELNTLRFRLALDGLFSITAVRSVYSPRLLDFLPKRLGKVMRGRMERCFARHPNATNPFVDTLSACPTLSNSWERPSSGNRLARSRLVPNRSFNVFWYSRLFKRRMTVALTDR